MKEAGKQFLTLIYRAFAGLTGFNKPRFVLVMGHMRSGSSLLSHLLLSNPQIMGLGESNAIYRSQNDLWKLVMKSQWKNKQFSKAAIYLDQINHNEKTPITQLLQKANIQLIFLIRQPDNAVASIIKLTEDYYTPWSQEQAENYLTARYQWLLELAQSLPADRVMWLEYENLTSNSDEQLSRLNDFLALKIPLSSNYETFSFSGKHGDPSENLKSGKINPEDKNKTVINVSATCQQAYAKCLELACEENRSKS